MRVCHLYVKSKDIFHCDAFEYFPHGWFSWLYGCLVFGFWMETPSRAHFGDAEKRFLPLLLQVSQSLLENAVESGAAVRAYAAAHGCRSFGPKLCANADPNICASVTMRRHGRQS
jgi:hypothetical protein